MSSPVQMIFAGDTSDVWEIGLVTSRAGISPVVLAALGGAFSCRLVVAGAVPPIDRVISAQNLAGNRFLAWLTPAETLALGKGSWQVAIMLSNPALVPPLVREVRAIVRIETNLVPRI